MLSVLLLDLKYTERYHLLIQRNAGQTTELYCSVKKGCYGGR